MIFSIVDHCRIADELATSADAAAIQQVGAGRDDVQQPPKPDTVERSARLLSQIGVVQWGGCHMGMRVLPKTEALFRNIKFLDAQGQLDLRPPLIFCSLKHRLVADGCVYILTIFGGSCIIPRTISDRLFIFGHAPIQKILFASITKLGWCTCDWGRKTVTPFWQTRVLLGQPSSIPSSVAWARLFTLLPILDITVVSSPRMVGLSFVVDNTTAVREIVSMSVL